MNACAHLYQPTCPRYPRKPSPGICKRCEKYADSGNARVPLTLSATRKQSLQVQPIPRDKWGEGLNEWIAQRIDSDAGIGSTLARIGTPEAKAILIQLTHGTGCKCKDRTAKADALYPYAVTDGLSPSSSSNRGGDGNRLSNDGSP